MGDQSGCTTITGRCTTSTTTRSTANNKIRREKKREEMPKELPNWRQTSDPVVVGAKEIDTISEQKLWSES